MNNILFNSCTIKPLEIKGIIVGIYITTKGTEYQVRYYWNGEQKTEYFFDFEIEVLND
jgi:hypothetical protein